MKSFVFAIKAGEAIVNAVLRTNLNDGKNFTVMDVIKPAAVSDDLFPFHKGDVLTVSDVIGFANEMQISGKLNIQTLSVEEPDNKVIIDIPKAYEAVSNVSELPSGAEAREASISIGEVINDFASNDYFENILVSDAQVEKTVTLKSLDKVVLDNISIAGGKDNLNGKITYAAKELRLSNISAIDGATLYNAFEGYQKTDDPDYKGLKKLIAENLNINCPSLTHNIINVYTPASGAEIIIKDSKFNLTVDNSNILRLANYLNAENVKVTFENCDWTYENGLSFKDWNWAGLVIYQPAGADVALNGDLSKLASWSFKFKNCRYNGIKVTENNFGEHNQVFYLYNVGNTKKVENPVEKIAGIDITFE